MPVDPLLNDVMKPLTDEEKLSKDVDTLLEQLRDVNQLLNIPNPLFEYERRWQDYRPAFNAPDFETTLQVQRKVLNIGRKDLISKKKAHL